MTKYATELDLWERGNKAYVGGWFATETPRCIIGELPETLYLLILC